MTRVDRLRQRSGSLAIVTGLVVLAAVGLGIASRGERERTPIDIASLGPQVGEQVPDFRLPDQHGQVQTLRSILGPNGAILLFHRSADW